MLSSLYDRICRGMNTALQRTPPNGTFIPCALLNDVPLNPFIRHSTSDFLRKEIRIDDSHCPLKSMTLLKYTEKKQHEMVAVSVIVPSRNPKWPEMEMTMFFERRICNGKDVEDERRRERRGSSETQASVCVTAVAPKGFGSSSELPVNTASDIVIIPRNGKQGWKKAVEVAFGHPSSRVRDVYTIMFPENPPPSLLDLAVLLNKVSETYRNYHLFKHQCYFYAELVCETMCSIFRGQKREGPNQDQPITPMSVEDSESTDVDSTGNGRSSQVAGTYKIFRIVNGSLVLEEVEKLHEAFYEARKAKLDGLEEHQSDELREARHETEMERTGRLEERELRLAAEDRAKDLERRLEEAQRQYTSEQNFGSRFSPDASIS